LRPLRERVPLDHDDLKSLADQGDADAQYQLANILLSTKFQDITHRREAAQLFRLAASKGHTMAQQALNWSFLKGNGS
jgi:TPR repeat protein